MMNNMKVGKPEPGIVKFIYSTITMMANVDPIYHSIMGIVIDRNTDEIIYTLPKSAAVIDFHHYCYLRLEFDSYYYVTLYIAKTNSYKKIMIGKIYHLYFYFNLKSILVRKPYLNNLKYYVINLQIQAIKKKKNYNVDLTEVANFIKTREHTPIQFVKCNYFPLDHNYYFDIRTCQVVATSNVEKQRFAKQGGIIETDNVKQLIQDDFFKGKNLIILPENMMSLWNDCDKITFDNLLLIDGRVLKEWKSRKFDRIIIHECHLEFLVAIKSLVKLLNCKVVWIINSLPLRYYFPESENKCIRMSLLVKLSNLWMEFDAYEKKVHMSDIGRLILTEFNKYYIQVSYPIELEINEINVHLNSFETSIYKEFNKYYDNWKTKLMNNCYNTHKVMKEKLDSIETNIFNAVVMLLTSIKSRDKIDEVFKDRIQNTLSRLNVLDICLMDMIKIYVKFERESNHFRIIEGKTLAELNKKKAIISNRMTNYKRYSDIVYSKIVDDPNCPICYESTNPFTRLICGHAICIYCMLNTIASRAECPICREYIIINKMVIMKETVGDHKSDLLNFLKELDESTVLLTDFSVFDDSTWDKLNVKVINIGCIDSGVKIKKMKMVTTIVTLMSPNALHNKFIEFLKVVSHFRLINSNLKIRELTVR